MKRRSLSVLLGLVLVLLAAGSPAVAAAPRIVVVLKAGTPKGPLGPYEEAAKGFRAALQPKAEVLIAPGMTDNAVQSITAQNPDLLVAFGAEAAQFAETNFPAVPRVVALAPGVSAAPDAQTPTAVISPDIGADLQVRWIHEALPDVKRVGVLFDPAASQSRVDELVAEAAKRGTSQRPIEIVPIEVGSAAAVPAEFKKAAGSIDALLFIPDPTVITKGTLDYLMPACARQSIPTIGFNWYFVDNGAVLGFGLDYEAVGQQAAGAARSLSNQSWVAAPKKVTIWINRRVADKLRIRTAYDPAKVTEIR